MLIWIVLFLLVSLVSFLLAYRSMRNYQEAPGNFSLHYSLYLVQKPEMLSGDFFKHLQKLLSVQNAPISFEILARGTRRAIVVYGPVEFLQPISGHLGLLELEDYSQKVSDREVQGWELGPKSAGQLLTVSQPLKIEVELQAHEECWCQIILQPTGSDFQGVARFITLTSDVKRQKLLSEDLLSFAKADQLVRLPQKYNSKVLLEQYQKRVFQPQGEGLFKVHPSDAAILFNLFVRG